MSEYCAQFESTLQNDNYTSITVYNEAEFKRVVDQFPWNKRGQEQVTSNFNMAVINSDF